MNPTIGSIVIYHPMKDGSDGVYRNGDLKDLPAIIVGIWSQHCVNLKVITDGPTDSWVTSVTQGESERSWSWPVKV